MCRGRLKRVVRGKKGPLVTKQNHAGVEKSWRWGRPARPPAPDHSTGGPRKGATRTLGSGGFISESGWRSVVPENPEIILARRVTTKRPGRKIGVWREHSLRLKTMPEKSTDEGMLTAERARVERAQGRLIREARKEVRGIKVPRSPKRKPGSEGRHDRRGGSH